MIFPQTFAFPSSRQSGVFTPSALSGYVDSPLIAPLRETNQIYIDGGKTTAGTAAGQRARVIDAGSLDYTAASDAASPLLVDETGGKWSVNADGVDDMITLPYNAAYGFGIGGNWSMTGRFRTNALGVLKVLFSLNDAAVLSANFTAAGVVRMQNDSGSGGLANLGSVGANTWFNLALWVTGSTLFGQLNADPVQNLIMPVGWTTGPLAWLATPGYLMGTCRGIGFVMRTAAGSDSERAALRTYLASLTP